MISLLRFGLRGPKRSSFLLSKRFYSVPSDTIVTAASDVSSQVVLDGSPFSPVNLIALTLENFHHLSGTSWPVSIALFTLGIRCALFPFTVMQTKSSINANNLRPTVERLRTESMSFRSAGNQEKAKAKMLELAKFMKDNKIGVGRLLGLGLVPVPIFMSTFFALRKLTSLPLPDLNEAGLWWIENLCAPDPFYILPVLTTASLLSSIEAARFLNPNTNTPAMKMFMRGMAFVSIPVTAFMPSAMVLYFVVSNTITTGIQLLWRSSKIRQLLGIPLPKPAQGQTTTSQGSFMENFMSAYKSAVNAPASPSLSVVSSKEHEKTLRKAARKLKI